MPSSQVPVAPQVAHDDGLRKPWGTIIAFLLPALTLYAGFTAYPAIRLCVSGNGPSTRSTSAESQYSLIILILPLSIRHTMQY